MPRLDWCVCCAGRAHSPLYRGLLFCRDCGHAWYPQIPENPDLERVYDKDYFLGNEYLDYALERSGLVRNFRHRYEILKRLHPSGGKLYEAGCSYGYFLRMAAQHFDVAGSDISSHAVEQALKEVGPVVTRGDYLQVATEPEEADVVCFWDTIEHLPRPDLAVQKAAQQLKRGGTLAISTGDIGSPFARLRGSRWRLIHPPSHLHYFTRNSLERLLVRTGLQVWLVKRPWFWRNAQAVAYRVLCAKGSRIGMSIYRLLLKSGCLGFCFPLNLYDLMDIYARKP
jgi:SAM-dependent methyltransferase